MVLMQNTENTDINKNTKKLFTLLYSFRFCTMLSDLIGNDPNRNRDSYASKKPNQLEKDITTVRKQDINL